MLSRRAKWSIAVAALVVLSLVCWYARHWLEIPYDLVVLRHVINQEKRFLIYEIDHDVLARTLREFAEEQHWAEVGFNKDDLRLPAALRVLKPSAVFIHPDYIALDFGGPFLAMDIRAYKSGLAGEGTKKLAEGLWFYSEDGTYPRNP
jgi:hypothetical protein